VDRTRFNPTSHSTQLWLAAPGCLRLTTGAVRNVYPQKLS